MIASTGCHASAPISICQYMTVDVQSLVLQYIQHSGLLHDLRVIIMIEVLLDLPIILYN